MNRKRWFDILNNLSTTSPTTSDELATILNISSRTVRNELKEISEVLKKEGAHLISKPNSGTLLVIENYELYQSFLDSLNKNTSIPETSQERIQYLLETLLVNKSSFVKLEDLVDQIYISKSSLTGDLKEVRSFLEDYNLKLIARPGYGIRVEGSEFDLRLCIAAFTISRLEDQTKNGILRSIAECVQQGLIDSNLKINDGSYQNLIVHLYIALQRIEEGCYVPLEKSQLDVIRNEVEFKQAQKIVDLLEKRFEIEIPLTEVGYVAIHLASKRIIEKQDLTDQVIIDSKVNETINRMLNEILINYHIDFRDDLELRMVLGMHLIPLNVRLQYDMNLKNPLLKQIKTRYTLAYMLAVSACGVLEKENCKIIQEDEIGYFALHFNLALERRKKTRIKKNVLVVCSTGRGSAQLLLWKIKEEFGKDLNRIEICDVFQLETYDLSDIDYIFSTVAIPFQVNRPIVQVEVFLENKDIKAIHHILNEQENFTLSKYFHPNLFLSKCNAKTKEEVIDQMVKKIRKYKNVPNDFKDSVLEREKLAVTSFGNLVAVPHPNKAMGDESFVCVAILEKPIKWDKQKVQFVFMMSLKAPVEEDMQMFSQITSQLLFSQKYINEMIKNPEFSYLMKILGTIEKDIKENNG